MISKVFTGHSFSGSIRYVLQQQKHGQLIDLEGVRGHDKQLMIDDFVRQHALRPEKKQACFHSVLSFYPGEKPDDALIRTIAREYLEGLKITDTQFAVIKHTDKDHLHIHIIANLINNQGKSIADNFIGLRGKKEAQRLTLKHKLILAQSKKLGLTHLTSLRIGDQHRYQIYQAITRALRYCTTVDQLEHRLRHHNIELQFKYKGQTQEKQGVSFRLGNYCFKGSEVDRKFSLNNLERTLALRQQQQLQLVKNEEKAAGFKHSPLQKQRQVHENFVRDLVTELLKGLAKQVDFGFKPTITADYISPELLREAKRKRKRHRQSR